MALTWKTVKGVTTLTWESPTMGAFWKIDPTMDDEQVAEILTGVVLTLKGVKMNREQKINALEQELGIVPTQAVTPPAGTPAAAPAASAGTAVPVPPATPGKILMMPPSSLGDAPAGGAPVSNGNDWSAMPTTTVPEHLQKAWEMIPPEEKPW